METKIKIIFTFILGLFLQPVLALGDDTPVKEINEHLKSLHSFASFQKVYLHLDKAGYRAGESIWFKAYVFDGVSHIPVTDTNNVYIDLINSEGKVMDMRIVLADDGYAWGDMELRSELPEGNYVLRAYTDWMKNFSEDYYFTHYLYIKNRDYENMIPRFDVLKNRFFNRRLNRIKQRHEVAFFPEGGDILSGVNNRVAFKVVDELGHGQDAEGKIIDQTGIVVATFRTEFSGIGTFEIEPEEGKSYIASVSVDGDKNRDYDFPDVLIEGYSLKIDQKDGKINVRVVSTVKENNSLYSEKLILIGHSRGVPGFGDYFNISGNSAEFSIDENLFPSGIAHFTLFTEEYLPVAERLIFVDHKDYLTFSPRINTSRVDGKDFFDLQFTVKDIHGEPVAGSFSFSAVTGHKDPDSYRKDILSYILLGSDLKEMIRDPSPYLQTDVDVSADDLLLIYGWRRFNWNEALAGELPEIRFPRFSGLAIGGKLLDPANDTPLNNYPVKLYVKSGHDDLYETETESRGAFSFPGLLYEGVVEIELSSRRLPDGYPPVFDLNIKSAKDYDFEYNIYTRKRRITSRGDDWERVRGVSSSPFSSSLDRNTSPRRYGNPDQTIYIDHDKLTEGNLYELLRNKASNLRFQGGEIMIRGQSSLTLSNEPRFMLDGTFIDRDHFLRLYPGNIERIEIFSGTSTAIFGTRGATGVIAAYSRKPGHRGFEDVIQLAIMGYHSPSEFYHDRLPVSAIDSPNELPETTVHWEPDLKSVRDGKLTLSFPIHEGTDNLKVMVEGTGHDGKIGFTEFVIDINQ